MLRRRPNLLTRDIDGETVILDRERGKIHQLNATASCIWNECDGSQSAEQIARRVAAAFGGAPQSVVKDVERSLDEFHVLGLLVDASTT